MIILAIYAAFPLQQTASATPPSAEMRKLIEQSPDKRVRLKTPLAQPKGSVTRPLAVADDKIPSPTKILLRNRHMAELAKRDGDFSAVPPLTESPYLGCKPIADFASGFKLAASSRLDGRRTTYDCGTFVVELTRSDMTQPQEGVTTRGFAPAELDAVVNNGATRHAYRRTASGLHNVSIHWISRAQDIAILLTSGSEAFDRLSSIGDAILDRLTRFNAKPARR